MILITKSGWESMGTWLLATSCVVAPIRFATNRSMSGWTVRSFVGNDVPAWLRSPGSSSDFRVEQVGSRSEVGRPNQLLFLLGQIARCWVWLASISFCSPLVSPHFVFDRAGQQHISRVNSRLFGAWSLQDFAAFVVFCPKISR